MKMKERKKERTNLVLFKDTGITGYSRQNTAIFFFFFWVFGLLDAEKKPLCTRKPARLVFYFERNRRDYLFNLGLTFDKFNYKIIFIDLKVT